MAKERVISNDAARLIALAKVNDALAGGSSLRASLQRVLQLLDRRDSVVCSSITLLNLDSGLLQVEASEGLTPEGRSARYAIGEGVTGRVVESGRPVIVPRASKEPTFLNRARRKNLDRRDISFICVPIKTRKKPVGALSIDLPFEKGRDYQGYVRVLDVVASMIAYQAAQMCDVTLFHFWKRLTRGRHLWLRNNGSTVVSQFVDTFAVITITHYWARGLPIDENLAIWPQLWVFIGSGYVFKLVVALLDTLPFYLGVRWLSEYLQIDPLQEHAADVEALALVTIELEHPNEHRRHPLRQRHAVALDQLQGLQRIEALHDDRGRAEPLECHREAQRRGVVERRG